jgi:lipoprotein-anchoring transpeptidase ErfK/SrfK
MASRLFSVLGLAALSVLLSSCATTPGPYHSKAYRPTNPDNVHVKVSLANRMVYVMEGDRALLVTPTAIGKPESPTPLGTYKVFQKIEKKRSNTYGYAVTSDGTFPVKRTKMPRGARYVGFPMPYWVEFKSGYGFHTGSVWPTPRSHGCLRLHANVAPKFFALVPVGTPVHIANSLPEDATLGRNIPRPTDYADPDPPISVMTSPAAFPAPSYPLFEN